MHPSVLVVGGAGYIGGAVTEQLLKCQQPIADQALCGLHDGVDFTVYDALLYEHQYLKPVPFLRGNVLDEVKLLSAMRDKTHLIWLAAIVGDAACDLDPALTRRVNVDAPIWAREHFAGRFIYPSTCSVYGCSDGRLTEESPTQPLTLYAQTKLEAERALATHDNTLIFRLGTAYGISDNYSRLRLDLVVNTFAAQAAAFRQVNVLTAKAWRPFIHTRDIALELVRAINRTDTGVYNLARENRRIIELAELAVCLSGCHIKDDTNYSNPDKRDYRVDTAKALGACYLNMSPMHDVESGMVEVMEAVQSGRIYDPEGLAHYNHLRMRSRAEDLRRW